MNTVKATIKRVPVSPKKLILVGAQLRGKSLDDAHWIIDSSAKSCATYFNHALTNAEAMLKDKSISQSEAFIKSINISQANRLKRQRAGSRGYSNAFTHHLSHLTLELAQKQSKKISKAKKLNKKTKLRRPKNVVSTESRSKASGKKNGPQN